ncbi:hypothetical protein MPSEU_000278700 [Mayamaea pseudoterrestris]|nr:hypothetical protein MPSEU_000278700 [Mayamaea pseudoterrestris]
MTTRKTGEEISSQNKGRKQSLLHAMTKTTAQKRKFNPGDEGYKSATQLRNERKRRAAKKPKSNAGRKNDAARIPSDPSLMYILSPTKAPIIRKAVQFFREHLAGNFEVVLGPVRGWRTVSKLAVRQTKAGDKELCIGLFQPKTHDLIPGSGSTSVHHPSINAAVQQIQLIARSCNIAAYDEATGKGDLRNVAVNIERSTGKVQATIIWNGDAKDKEEHGKAHQFATRLIADMKKRLHSLWIHFNASWKHDNAIISHTGSWECVYGPEQIVEYLDESQANSNEDGHDASLAHVPLHFPPFVFRQANLDAFTKIVSKIRSSLSAAHATDSSLKHCVELYGGVGTIGLAVADLFETFVSSDENPHNKACFDKSIDCIKSDTIDFKTRISYVSANAETMVANGCFSKADCVIVDPPRKGLDQSVVDSLCANKRPRLLVYVSCGFDAFVRDYQALVRDGQWKCTHAEGHILFPGSDAIETLAFFRREATCT